MTRFKLPLWWMSVLILSMAPALSSLAAEEGKAPGRKAEKVENPIDLIGGAPEKDREPARPNEDIEAFKQAWKEFATFSVVDLLIALALSTILAAIIAYHPRSYGKAATLEEAEQPKIFLLYAVIGTIVAQVVEANGVMGLVIFGLGGLFRFRTDVGPAKDTGRVILVTCIGICCGLKIYPAAVLGTAFAWFLIYFLEGRVAHRVVVKGIEPTLLPQASEAYEDVLRENGFNVMSEKRNFLKGQVAFVFRAPGKLDREELELLFKDIPPKLQGAPDWEQS